MLRWNRVDGSIVCFPIGNSVQSSRLSTLKPIQTVHLRTKLLFSTLRFRIKPPSFLPPIHNTHNKPSNPIKLQENHGTEEQRRRGHRRQLHRGQLEGGREGSSVPGGFSDSQPSEEDQGVRGQDSWLVSDAARAPAGSPRDKTAAFQVATRPRR